MTSCKPWLVLLRVSLMVVFDDDSSKVTWENFDLCEINKVTIKYNRSANTVSADVE